MALIKLVVFLQFAKIIKNHERFVVYGNYAHTYPAATQKRCGCFIFMSNSHNVLANACA